MEIPMKKTVWWLAVILTAFSAGCGGGKARIEPQVPVFDAKKYLTAEAWGPTQGEAKRSAMAELAAIFNARVRAETQSRANAYVSAADDERFEKQVDQMVRIETDVQLEGARIGWVKPEEKTGGYRALAVLDRDQAAGRWRNELARIHMALDTGLDSLSGLKGRLPRLSALNRLSLLSGQMAVAESRLSVLGRPAILFEGDLGAVFAERDRLIDTTRFFIQIDGDAAESFAHRLGALMTAQGYRMSGTADQAAGLISGKFWLQPLFLDNPDVLFVRALADISITDLDTHTEIAAFSENVRKGHMDENEARRKAIDQLAQQTAADILKTMGTLGMPAGVGNAE
jgi:hypothetical protein